MSTVPRMSINDVDPNAYRAVLGLQKYVNKSGLDKALIALVDVRASQLNRCAWCLDMHVAEAREAGIPQRQIDLIAAWEEAGELFTARQRAVLAFTEQVTLISERGVSDGVWAQVRAVFSEEETVQLLMTIATINVWNRMNVTVHNAPPLATTTD